SNVMLLTEGDLTMPDMTGWTRDDIVAFQSLTDIKVEVKGSGFVKSQSTAPQSAIDKNSKIEVTLDSEKTE
ncbi:PASTA domain-containing protein, partial [Staphylococcus epidermidis]